MEEDNVLHAMAKFDFSSSANVTNIIFEDSNDEENNSESEHSDKISKNKRSDNLYESKQRPEVTELQKYLETATQKKNMNNINLKVANDQKCHEHTVFNQIENISQNLFFKDVNKEKTSVNSDLYNTDSVDGVEAIKLNNDDFEDFWSTMKKSLMNISTHIIIIIKSLNKYNKIKNDPNSSEIEIENAESNYIIMKKLCFKLIYCTTISILVPQEHNKEFMKDVINTTVKIANMYKKTDTSIEQIQIMFQELMEWAKQQKNRPLESKELKVNLDNWSKMKKIEIKEILCSDVTVIPKTNQLSSKLLDGTQISNEVTVPLQDTAVTSFSHTENNTNDINIIVSSHSTIEPSCSEIFNSNQVIDINQKHDPMQQTSEPIIYSCFSPLSKNDLAPQNRQNSYEKQQITDTINIGVNPILQIQVLKNKYPNLNSIPPTEFHWNPTQHTRPQYYNENYNPYPLRHSNNVINNVHKTVPPNQQYYFTPNLSSYNDKHTLPKNCTLMELQNIRNNITPHSSITEIQSTSYRYQNILSCGYRLGRDWRLLRHKMTIAKKTYNPHNSFGKQISPNTNNLILHKPRPQPLYPSFGPTQSVDDQNRTNNYQIRLKVQNANNYQKGQYYGSIEIQNQNNAIDTTRSTSSRDSGIASPTYVTPIDFHNNTTYEDNRCSTPIITHTTSLNPNMAPICNGNCYLCGKVCNLKCIGCYKTYYCSYECQEYDWIHHKINCEVGNRL